MPVAPRSPALQDCGLGRHLLSRCPPPSALPSPPLGHRGAGRAHLSPVAPRQEQRRPPGPGESCLPPLEGLPGTGGSRVSRGSRGSRGRAEASGPQPRPMAPARPDPSPGTASQAAARPVCPWGQRRSPWTRSSPEPGPHPQARGCFPGSKRPGGVNESHWEATAAALSHPGDDDTRRPPAADSQGGGDTAPHRDEGLSVRTNQVLWPCRPPTGPRVKPDVGAQRPPPRRHLVLWSLGVWADASHQLLPLSPPQPSLQTPAAGPLEGQ